MRPSKPSSHAIQKMAWEPIKWPRLKLCSLSPEMVESPYKWNILHNEKYTSISITGELPLSSTKNSTFWSRLLQSRPQLIGQYLHVYYVKCAHTKLSADGSHQCLCLCNAQCMEMVFISKIYARQKPFKFLKFNKLMSISAMTEKVQIS